MQTKLDRTYIPNKYCLKMSKKNKNEPHRLRHYDSDGDMDFDIDFNNHHNNKRHNFTHDGAHKHYYKYEIIDGIKTLVDHSEGENLTEEEYEKYVLNYEELNPEIIL